MVNPTQPRVVVVTGAAGYVGSRFLQELENEESLSKIIAIDKKPLPLPIHNSQSYRLDMTQPLDTVFKAHDVDTVIHLAFDLREGRDREQAKLIQQNNIMSLNNILKACQAHPVQHFIYLSSHTVYGAYSDNPIPLMENAPLRSIKGFQYSRSKTLAEEIIKRFGQDNPEISVTVLRSCMVMGPGSSNYVANSFQKPFLIGVAGYDPPLQFIHEKDLGRILTNFTLEPRAGVFNLAGEGIIRYSELAQLFGRRLVKLPSIIAYPLVRLSWKLRLQSNAQAEGLDLIRYPIIISTAKLKQITGFRCLYTAKDAVRSFVTSNL